MFIYKADTPVCKNWGTGVNRKNPSPFRAWIQGRDKVVWQFVVAFVAVLNIRFISICLLKCPLNPNQTHSNPFF